MTSNLSTKKRNNTPSLKESELSSNWFVIDAEDIVLGRLASFVANILRGKNKASYTPHMNCGDYVVIINAEKVALTGKKSDRNKGKTYYWHTGYPGGIKQRTATQILEGKFPERVIEKAVQRMMPGGPLSNKQLSKLKVYAGSEHPHSAQQPKTIDFASLNKKNAR